MDKGAVVNELISKELFCSVMGYPLEEVRNLTELESNSEDGVIYIKFWGRYVGGVKPEHGQCSFKQRYINIHELAHKCKVWAVKKGFILQITYGMDLLEEIELTIDSHKLYNSLSGGNEIELVFKACEWIREQLWKRY